MIGSQPAGKAFSADSEQFEPVVACTEELDQLLGRAVDRFVTLARHEDLRGASARDEPMHHCPDEAGFSGARRSLEQTERAARKDRSKCGPLPAIERIGIAFAVCRSTVIGCRSEEHTSELQSL